MGQNRLDLPNGAESTCLGSREGTASRGFHPPEAVRFQTVKQEIRRIPILKLCLAVELLNKKRHLKRCLFYCMQKTPVRPGVPLSFSVEYLKV